MANKLFNYFELFNNANLGSIRVALDSDGNPWFVAKDITDRLGFVNGRDAISKHVEVEDKGVAKCDTLGGAQDYTVISEAGMYSLVLSSKLESARELKRWITREVIPSIRKHGGYILGQERLDDPTELHKQIEELQAEVEKQTAGKAKLNGYLQQTEDFYETLLGENKNLKAQVDDLKEKLDALERENYLLKNPQPENKGNKSEITFYVGEDGLLFPFDFKNL